MLPAGGGELDETLVIPELLGAAAQVGLPKGEARSNIQSGLRGGAREPRRRPATIDSATDRRRKPPPCDGSLRDPRFA